MPDEASKGDTTATSPLRRCSLWLWVGIGGAQPLSQAEASPTSLRYRALRGAVLSNPKRVTTTHLRETKRATKPAEFKTKQNKNVKGQGQRKHKSAKSCSPGGRHPQFLVSSLGSCKKQAPSLLLPLDEGVFCAFHWDIQDLPHSQHCSGMPRRSGIQLRWGPALPRTLASWERQ